MDAATWKNSIWKSLQRGSVDGKHPFRYLYLATAGTEGPQQRTVVLRQVDIPSQRLFFYSDWRTQKIRDLRQNAEASILAYHPKKMLQVRLNGSISLHQDDALAAEHWAKIPEGRQSDYNSQQAPGSPLKDPKDIPRSSEAQGNFVVLEFEAQLLDALQLSREGHRRLRFERQGGDWQGGFVVP